jgi:hypothetical protein
MDRTQEFVDHWLDRAMEEFDDNPLCSTLIRRLAQESPEPFAQAALRHLGQPGQSTALTLLAGLMLRDNAVFEFLAQPGKKALERARFVIGRLMLLDPSFDVKVAKQLPDRTGVNQATALTGVRGARILEILDEVSRGRRLVPLLAHLPESTDPLLSEKATLFIGRRVQSAAWAEKQMDAPDPKVRANAIESIWGVDTPAARTLLERCKKDRSDKVAGNGFVGLHMLGDPGIVEEIQSMAVASNTKARATAAWTMGRIADPSFADQLASLVKDEDENVRGTALQALLGLRREEAIKIAAAPKLAEVKVVEEVVVAVAEKEPEVIAVEPPEAEAPEPEPAMPVFELRLDGSNFRAAPSRFTSFRRGNR